MLGPAVDASPRQERTRALRDQTPRPEVVCTPSVPVQRTDELVVSLRALGRVIDRLPARLVFKLDRMGSPIPMHRLERS